MSVLIWTRSIEDWDDDQKLFLGREMHMLHLPCIATTGINGTFPKDAADVLVFTSANGVHYAGQNAELLRLMRKAKSVYAIGPTTQNALRDLGIASEVHADVKNSEQLGLWLSQTLAKGSRLTWPAAEEPSFDLCGYLAAHDLHVEHLAVYTTAKKLLLADGTEPDEKTVGDMVQKLSGVVCFASPSAVAGFVQTLKPTENRLHQELTAVAIGRTTAAACVEHFDRVEVIDEPRVELLAEVGESKYRKPDGSRYLH